MSKWIEVDALIADLDKGLWGKDWDKALAEAIIREAPSIERKKGKWIQENIVLTSNPPKYRWYCSECGEVKIGYDCSALKNFCPNCGADMKGTDDE